MFPSPKELDAQALIKVDAWVDIDSERLHEVDDDPALTKKWIRMLMKEPAYLFADSDGRVWGKGVDGFYYPYHVPHGKKLYGIRISRKAAN